MRTGAELRSNEIPLSRLTFLRILHVAHPCMFRRARPALGDREGDCDRRLGPIVVECAPIIGSGGMGER